jgi:hypothetical protein
MIFTKKYIANPLILQYVILSMRNSYLKRKEKKKTFSFFRFVEGGG